MDRSTLLKLRHRLHQHPELAHHETKTQNILDEFFDDTPAKRISLAQGKAVLYQFASQTPGPAIIFRADLDALPIATLDDRPYASRNDGVSHTCGHDGHMALVSSLALAWQRHPEAKGKLGLLFQHAEETGEGAQELIEDETLKAWKPDAMFGFHNLPGLPVGTVAYHEETFASASLGLEARFLGHSSHAGEPSKAHSPWLAMSKLMSHTGTYRSVDPEDDGQGLITTVHVALGGKNHGIAPGDGRIAWTLRGISDEIVENLKQDLTDRAKALANFHHLSVELEQCEAFPATNIDPELLSLLIKAGEKLKGQKGLELQKLDRPQSWSEDFGHYQALCPTLYFGLGIGETTSALHTPAYDFNDDAFDVYPALLETLWSLSVDSISCQD